MIPSAIQRYIQNFARPVLFNASLFRANEIILVTPETLRYD